jgi:hypothetical protein
MAVPFLGIISGMTDISGQLLELYKTKRDGSFFEQQAFSSKLREYEADAADERAAKREILLAKLGEERAQSDHLRSSESQLTSARINVALQRELQADTRLLENAPYDYDQRQLAEIVSHASGQGIKPALLIAPFFDDELSASEADNGPPAFRVAIRRSWISCAWANDAALLDGLLKRPLRNTDLDVLMIRQALRALPVIVIHGEIQGQNRVWCSVTAWNIAPPYAGQSITINLPPLPFPQPNSHRKQERIEFEDGLGWAVAVTAGVLVGWFHLIRSGRVPKLHRQLDGDTILLREVGPGLAAAYDVAIAANSIDVLSGRMNQAVLLAESGYQEIAVDILRGIVNELDGRRRLAEPDGLELLRKAKDIASVSGDDSLTNIMQRSLDEESKRFLVRFLNLPPEEA